MFRTQRAVVISAGEQENMLVDKTQEITKMITTSNFDLMFILLEVRNKSYQYSRPFILLSPSPFSSFLN